ncbi:MAG: hypothetical protein KatS3mg042_0214 [Rhodothermaceae bacterium]|nr:MAG: hypothetical protein KatS3mg042_0214 [Rhodothermaceae bacterium]
MSSPPPRPPAGLRVLLTHLIDYAGLFPPARLSLDEALRSYVRYRRSDEAWMLGRFVLPAARLGELPARAGRVGDAGPIPLSVLATGGADAPAFMDALSKDLAAMTALTSHHGDLARPAAMEAHLPVACLAADLAPLRSFFDDVTAQTVPFLTDTPAVFFEVPLSDDLPRLLPPVLDALAACRDEAGRPRLGLKLRTGGLTPEAIPPPDRLAFALTAARRAGVPLKTTAGLHHPVRHVDPHLGVPLYGFFNVFVAAVLDRLHALDEATLRTILTETSAEAFHFSEEGLAWRDLAATPEDVRNAREAVIAFGSCSFDEPRDDLRRLGLL